MLPSQISLLRLGGQIQDAVLAVGRADLTLDGHLEVLCGTADGQIIGLTPTSPAASWSQPWSQSSKSRWASPRTQVVLGSGEQDAPLGGSSEAEVVSAGAGDGANNEKLGKTTTTGDAAESDHAEYSCCWNRTFEFPVNEIHTRDMDGDGIDEVVVVTSQSTHLFHHDTAVVQAKVNYAVGLLEDLAALRKQGSPGLI